MLENQIKIIDECILQGITQKEQIAYILATTEWETNYTYNPVKEAYWLSETWRRKNLRYYPYYGRGLVQITWEENYKKFSDILNIDLVGNPDLALDFDVAKFILVYGFKHGSFTGKNISEFINKTKVNYLGARQCINGTDHASDIKQIANKLEPKIDMYLGSKMMDDKVEKIKDLQKLVNKYGASLEEDGIIGPLTKEAISDFLETIT
jgi:hypothetical protein